MPRKPAQKKSVLDRLPNKSIVLTFNTDDLLDMFDLPALELDFDTVSDYWPSEGDLLDSRGLDLTEEDDPEGVEGTTIIVDGDGKPVSDDVLDELKQAIVSGVESGTRAKYTEHVKDALERTLMEFSDYPYNYDAMDSEGGWYQGFSGRAEGIQKVEVDYENTKVTTKLDLAHAINDCIAGVGMFEATNDLEGEDPKGFIESRFGHLKNYWKIYGTGKPDVGDSDEDFDDAYFAQLVGDLEKEHGLKLLTDSYRKYLR